MIFSVEFYRNKAIVKRKDSSIALEAKMQNGLYLVQENPQKFAGLTKIAESESLK